MIVFTTFTSTGYEAACERITSEVKACGRFDAIYTYNEKQLSPELLASPTFQIKKGLGHYSWKPDIIWQTLNSVKDGDIVVYLDAGCTVFDSKEWDKFFGYLEVYNILAFRLHQRNYRWTRKSVFDHFETIIKGNWGDGFQFGANALIVKKSKEGLSFVTEWRDYMINRLDLCGDVPVEQLQNEDKSFVENRYDQTILTALVYKYKQMGCIKTVWEHFEGYDPINKQAVIATRKRKGREHWNAKSIKHITWRLYKDYVMYPYYNVRYKKEIL